MVSIILNLDAPLGTVEDLPCTVLDRLGGSPKDRFSSHQRQSLLATD